MNVSKRRYCRSRLQATRRRGKMYLQVFLLWYRSTKSHIRKTVSPIEAIAGTNKPATRSASACAFGFVNSASSTKAAIRCTQFSWDSFVRLTMSCPSPFVVPAKTSESNPFAFGLNSPVIMDSSTSEPPYTTTPSVTILV
jgi:hypothetical protein